MTRVGICWLSGDHVHADFANSLVQLTLRTILAGRGIKAVTINTKCTIIADGRNEAATAAIAADCSHVFFIDSDMVVPDDTIVRLLDRDRIIVGATYMSRRPRPDLGRHVLLHREISNDDPTTLGTGLRQVAALPTGCLLIRSEALALLPKPWFYFGVNTSGHCVGEDYAFCQAATKSGMGLWLDADLSAQVGHIGSVTLYPGMFGHGTQAHA